MAQIPVTIPEFTDVEMTPIRLMIKDLKTALADKFINLEPEDRVRYGSINEKNKLIINKVADYRENQPDLSNPEIDWVKFGKNADTRKNFMMVIDALDEINEFCNDTRTLVDYVLFGDANKEYKFTKYKAEDDGGGANGFEAKYNALKQFYAQDNKPTS